MESRTPQHLLKIFSGPHTGAEVLLRDGQALVGSDDDCDLILNDRCVERQHVRISLSPDEVRLIPAEGATVLVGGQPIPAEGVVQPDFEYFTLGTTHMAIGPAEGPWPRTSFPDFQLAAPSPAVRSDPAPAAPESPVSPSVSPPGAISSRRRRRIALAVGALSLLIAFVWLAERTFQNTTADGAAAATPGRAIAEQLEEVLRAEQVAGLVHLSERGGKFRADGYLSKNGQRRALEKKLKQVAPTIELRLKDDETLLAGVQRMLSLHQLKLEAASGEPGEVIVRGKVADAKQWELVRDSIRNDLRSLKKLTEQVVVEDTSDSVAATASHSKAAAGRGPSKKAQAGDEIPEVSQPAGLGPMWDEMRAKITALQVGHTRSLVMENGDRLFLGSALTGGYVVDSIETDAVICSNGKQRFRLPFRSGE